MAIKYGRPIEARLAPVEAKIKRKPRLDLAKRPRRNRKAEWARRLVREHALTAHDLIWPLFLTDGSKTRVPVESMPGVERLSVDEAVREAPGRGARPPPPPSSPFHASRFFPIPTPSGATRTAARRSIPTIWCVVP